MQFAVSRMRSTKTLTNGSVNDFYHLCKEEALMPLDIVDYLDLLDGGDPLGPPKFSCQNCQAEMAMEYFRSHPEIIYDNREGFNEDKPLFLGGRFVLTNSRRRF